MKNWIVSFVLFISFHGFSQTKFNPYVPQTPYGVLSTSSTVYVCLGNYAYSYHSRSNCSGLNNCKAEIASSSEGYAISTLKRKPCCICWNNVSDDCYNDNKSSYSSNRDYGGGGSTGSNVDAQAAAGLALLLGSVAVISNDFYLHYGNNINAKNREINPNSYSFGFRKNFKESDLEYGVTINKALTKTIYVGGYSNGTYYYPYQEVTKSNNWNFHLAYLLNVHKLATNNDFNFFVGPTLNYTENIGFGGIMTSQYTLGKVVKLDLRYELTSNTNKVSIGLIFHYQDR